MPRRWWTMVVLPAPLGAEKIIAFPSFASIGKLTKKIREHY
jgi:hypothetical protein